MAGQQVNPPRGMRDFLPADKARRERVLRVIRDTYRAHGFDEIETPVMEDSERLHAGLGGDNEKLAYAVMKRGLSVDDLRAAEAPIDLADLGLRYDLTVPLSRFYASHRAELPTVFRALQLGSVWRAERPQKGRYRQFVQTDVDILGEPGIRAEAELVTASLAVLDALGLGDATIRVNDRRLLEGMLGGFGFSAEELPGVLITVDKLDKIGPDGVAAELRERGADAATVEAFQRFLLRPQTREFLPFGDAHIRKRLPEGLDDAVIADLVALGEAVGAARATIAPDPASPIAANPVPLVFDPFLVRGMGYYTGPIFEVAHHSVDYSIGGGGRYDGMVGRFLGTEVPATGFSLGFERLVDLVTLPDDAGDAIALVHDAETPIAELLRLQSALVATGARVRLIARAKNTKAQLDGLAAEGFGRFAFVPDPVPALDALDLKRLG